MDKRTAADVLSDPRPGDVVKFGGGITKIIRADDSEFVYQYRGPGSMAPPMPRPGQRWRPLWRIWAMDATVLHIAEGA